MRFNRRLPLLIISSIFLVLLAIRSTRSIDDASSSSTKPPKVLLISLDGLRYDFITPERTPSLWLLSRRGVFFEHGVKVQVHTVTASNHYSIVTGLYQESHGIVDNEFWDPVFDQRYDVWNFQSNDTQYEWSKLAYWYEGTTPIWQTNEEAKYSQPYDTINRRRSGSLYWPMGNCMINDRTIAKNRTWTDYGNVAIWRKEIDTMIDWFTDEKAPINFLLYYNAQPDHVEHYSDVLGIRTRSMVEDIDLTMGYMIDRLRETNLLDQVNIIMTADHGHAIIPDKEHIIELRDYIDYDKIIVNGRSIFPKPNTGSTVEEIYENLTRAQRERKIPMQVWRKEEFPSHYHYTNNRRIGPILAFEHLNYELWFYGEVEDYQKRKPSPFSSHGWLNDYAEMRAFFIAHGPAFKSGLIVSDREDIENIDIYPLMCKILGIDALPNNGSLERIAFILNDGSSSAESSSKWHANWTNRYLITTPAVEKTYAAALVLIPSISLCVLGLFCLLDRCQRRRRSKSAGGGGGGDGSVGYRLLRHASPEAHIDMTTSRRTQSPRRDLANNGSSVAKNSREAAEAFAKKQNGNKHARSSTAAGDGNRSIEDGRRQLVALSDESSDENEL